MSSTGITNSNICHPIAAIIWFYDAVKRNDNFESSDITIVAYCELLCRKKGGKKPTLTSRNTIFSSLNDCYLIVGLFVIDIYSCGSIKTDKVIIIGSSLELEHHRYTVRIEIVSDSNQLQHYFRSGRICKRSQHYFAIIIPANLPILSSVITHPAKIILGPGISHHARVIGIYFDTIKSTWCNRPKLCPSSCKRTPTYL
jgi:hypothetical protein